MMRLYVALFILYVAASLATIVLAIFTIFGG